MSWLRALKTAQTAKGFLAIGTGQQCHRLSPCKHCSGTSQFKLLNVEKEKDVAVLSFNHKPANAMSLEFLDEIVTVVDELEKQTDCRGLVLTSAIPGLFSAGIDLKELHKPEPERFRAFWNRMHDMWARIFISPLVVMAAINGNSPAGGCIVSMVSDYRVMTKGTKYTIGLNETQLGIIPPYWVADTMRTIISLREADMALQTGRMFTADEAHGVGLVDKLCDEGDEVNVAKEEMAKWLKVPDQARALTKVMQRQQLHDKIESERGRDVENTLSFLQQDSVQKPLEAYIKRLYAKSK